MGDPGPVIASVAFFITILASIVLIGPIGRAFAERLRGKAKGPALDSGEVEALRDELDSLRQQVSELAERQDFSERLLAQAREKGLLPAPKEK
jgi:uncharacterized protein YlxW (UPF0749 family)